MGVRRRPQKSSHKIWEYGVVSRSGLGTLSVGAMLPSCNPRQCLSSVGLRHSFTTSKAEWLVGM